MARPLVVRVMTGSEAVSTDPIDVGADVCVMVVRLGLGRGALLFGALGRVGVKRTAPLGVTIASVEVVRNLGCLAIVLMYLTVAP